MIQWIRKASTLALLAAVIVLMADIVATDILQKPPTMKIQAQIANVVGTTKSPAAVPPKEPPFLEYVEIIDSCGPYRDGACVAARSGPGEEFPKVDGLRNGMILRTMGTVEGGGRTWYKIVFDEWLRYPERMGKELYVASDYVIPFSDIGQVDYTDQIPTTTKRIIVDRSEQMLYAYDGDTLFEKLSISTGLEFTPTPRGIFRIYRKTPTRYMQGPLPGISDQYYDLPGVPWNLYFTEQGAVIHGAYWHDQFGKPWSHGCVNLLPSEAKKLYEWADLGTEVIVRD